MPKHTDHPYILSVALASPLRRLFDYLPPADADTHRLRPGMRVSVPFGRQTAIVGVIIAVKTHTDTPTNKMRAAHQILDEQQALDDAILALCSRCASYYHAPLGEVCHLALPALLRKPPSASKPALVRPAPDYWQLSDTGKTYKLEQFGRAKQQAALWQLAQSQIVVTKEHIKAVKITRATVRQLIEKGLLETTTELPLNHTDLTATSITNKEEVLTLNHQQTHAIKQIQYDQFACYLLEGVTGSGKTEVYLQAIAQVLKAGKQALVLVPEIGLTPQTLQRFQARFQVPIALLHSNMSDRQRLYTWQDAQQGLTPIIIGTRSAVFTPLPNLGLVIVDEEHDLSYKQQDGVRYCARDVAIIRAQQLSIPIVLGSATPALETLHNALSGRFVHLLLTERASQGSQMPNIRCVTQTSDELPPDILLNIQDTLANQQQVLVFINRRGYAPALFCGGCHWMAHCHNCDARMTIHNYQQRHSHLHCHHCDEKSAVPQQCPQCHSLQLQPVGQGTQRSEQTLQQHFPNTPVLRIDRDSMSRKGELETALETINEGKPCILVGTQMLAKGHHFAKVSLVVVLGMDNGFFSSDFRGAERMGQLLTQVAGRAGREQQQGTVLLHTQFADHPHLQLLLQEGYHALAQQLLGERQMAKMPPYQHMTLIRCHAQQPQLAIEFLQRVRQLAIALTPESEHIQYLGPLPAALEKRNNRYYYQLHIKASERRPLHQLLQPLCLQLEKERQATGLHWSIDVDPLET